MSQGPGRILRGPAPGHYPQMIAVIGPSTTTSPRGSDVLRHGPVGSTGREFARRLLQTIAVAVVAVTVFAIPLGLSGHTRSSSAPRTRSTTRRCAFVTPGTNTYIRVEPAGLDARRMRTPISGNPEIEVGAAVDLGRLAVGAAGVLALFLATRLPEASAQRLPSPST